MLTFGSLRSQDSHWKAELYVRANGTYGFRVSRLVAHEHTWVAVPSVSESVLASEGDAIAQAALQFPQLDPTTFAYFERPADSEDAPGSSRRALLAGFGAVGVVTGVGLLYSRALTMGTIILTLGCLGLGWSIGGFGGTGYGGSDS